MKKCSLCERTEETTKVIKNKDGMYLCGRCYQREKNNITYKIPEFGEIGYTEDGLPICHICGKAYKKVLSHAYQIHHITAYEYKKEFGLETTKSVMCDESKSIAREKAYENKEKVIIENLLKKGKNTRFKKGSKGRTKEMVSAKTKRELAERLKGIKS